MLSQSLVYLWYAQMCCSKASLEKERIYPKSMSDVAS